MPLPRLVRFARPAVVAGLVLGGLVGGAGRARAQPGGTFCEAPAALTDLVGQTYCGFAGGLYGGSNEPPPAHLADGLAQAALIRPLDTAGQPDPAGRVVLLSVSMSNATQEWCHAQSTGATGAPPCNPWTFVGRAAADPTVDHTALAVANGAKGGQALAEWDTPDNANYDRVRDEVLAPDGLTEAQVQAVWLKAALLREPTRPALPAPGADAFATERALGDVLRALRARYPNLRLVFVSSRIFSYAPAGTTNSPEPYAYETGFGAKWTIEAQARQRAGGPVDAEAGDLSGAVAPWVAWGPYLWAPGDRPRSDGLRWTRDLLQSDGVHPSEGGEAVVAGLLMDFFKGSPLTRPWFLAAPTAGEWGTGGASVPLTVSVDGTPTRGTSVVRLALAEGANVSVVVYDALGRRVAVLHDGPLGAGAHSLRLNASGLPAGVYVVSATSAVGVATQRLTVVR